MLEEIKKMSTCSNVIVIPTDFILYCVKLESYRRSRILQTYWQGAHTVHRFICAHALVHGNTYTLRA